MNQWKTLFKKEMLDLTRSLKWIWVPLVFILLCVMDPLTTYYMPQIMDALGGIPEGTVLDIPPPSVDDAVMMSLGQLSSLGMLVVILLSMGTITLEREKGIAELILVKPVSYLHYILSKWSAFVVLAWVSLFLGLSLSWYYINLLFGTLSFLSLLQITLFYGIWVTLVITLVIFYNTLLRKQGVVAFMTITTLIIGSVLTQAFGKYLAWSPYHLSQHIHDMLLFSEVSSGLLFTSLISVILIVLLLITSVQLLKTREIGE